MTLRQLALQSVRHHFRTHLGVVLGAALATAVLVGALAVGDSVKASLRQRALNGVGATVQALHSGERFFSAGLRNRLNAAGVAGTDLLEMPAVVARGDSAALVNQARVYGVEPDYSRAFTGRANVPELALAEDAVWVNEALARQLGVTAGSELVLRLAKPTALSRDAILTARNDATVAWRVTVRGVLSAELGGDLALNGATGAAVFGARTRLAALTGVSGRANLFLARDSVPPSPAAVSSNAVQAALRRSWTLDDAELSLRATNNYVELTTRRIFLEPAAVQAALSNAPAGEAATPVLTYLVNSLRHGERLTPYSMVTAAGAPYLPAGVGDDALVVSEWLAKDLGVRAGDTVDLAFYRADAGAQLTERTQQFRVHGIVPPAPPHADRTLMPEFPGLSKAESTHDWDAGFELVHPIRDQDEAYWKTERGTPKAFITLAAGQRLWANRFGELTAIRWWTTNVAESLAWQARIEERVRANLDASSVGLRFEPVRERVLTAANSGTGKDFGGLFLSLSFFLITAALLLTALFFRFSLEQRAGEIGTLLALGWPAKRVRWLFAGEGLVLAAVGSLGGAVLGALYGAGVIRALNTVWRAAVGGTALEFAVTPGTLLGGMAASILIAGLTLWWTLRSALQRPARELLQEGFVEHSPTVADGPASRARPWSLLLTIAAVGLALGALRASAAIQQPGFFFSGLLLLVAGILAVRTRLRRPPAEGQTAARTLGALARRSPARQPTRSLATITLLAAATFLIIAIAAYRLDATRDATARSAGTGGFALWAESALPVQQDLDTRKGREAYGLNVGELTNVTVVSLRVQAGDEASCLNLSRAQRPRLLGVKPEELARRGAFTFTGTAKGFEVQKGWELLKAAANPNPVAAGEPPEIPAIGDAQSIQWALGRSLGDRLDYVDERGQPFRIRLVGAVANSIWQGSLIIDEAELVQRFPSASGYRAFLLDVATAVGGPARTDELNRVRTAFSRALADTGFEVTTTTDRLDRFNAVPNTYLSTFQVLGGLGLLLGSVGLGVVVLRNVWERRGELAAMSAVGLSRHVLIRLVVNEHVGLLFTGLGLGFAAALVAVLPAFWNPGGGFPWLNVGVTLGLVLVNGLVWTWFAARRALAGDLLAALRGE